MVCSVLACHQRARGSSYASAGHPQRSFPMRAAPSVARAVVGSALCAARNWHSCTAAWQFFFRRELVAYGSLVGRISAGGNQRHPTRTISSWQAWEAPESDAYCCLHEQWGSAAWWLECLMYKL